MAKKDITSFVCPYCRKRQDKVGVVSECSQSLHLGTDDWTDLEVNGVSKHIYCINCGHNMPKLFQKLINSGQINGVIAPSCESCRKLGETTCGNDTRNLLCYEGS